jgi:shikimate dehydrogenase
MRLTAATRLLGVVGQPARHSLSPVLHNGWFAEHGIDAAYMAFEVADADFERAVSGLVAAGAVGLNVTLPFKERAAALARDVSGAAQRAGAANTLSFGAGGIRADNTDGAGFLLDLGVRAPGWRDLEGPVVVLGSGGAARGILAALIEDGRQNITILARSLDKAAVVAQAVGLPPGAVVAWQDAPRALDGAVLVVNATSLGLKDTAPFPIDLLPMHPNGVVYDTVYGPRTTAFQKAGLDARRTALDGLGMLAGQGALAFQIWFGVLPDVAGGLARLRSEVAR